MKYNATLIILAKEMEFLANESFTNRADHHNLFCNIFGRWHLAKVAASIIVDNKVHHHIDTD